MIFRASRNIGPRRKKVRNRNPIQLIGRKIRNIVSAPGRSVRNTARTARVVFYGLLALGAYAVFIK